MWNTKKKREAQEEKARARHEEEMTDRERNRALLQDTSRRADIYASNNDNGYGNRNLSEADKAARQAQRQRYRVGEATGSDDELEDELDRNLDELGDVASRLKNLAVMQGQEIESQKPLIERIDEKATTEERRIAMNTRRVSTWGTS